MAFIHVVSIYCAPRTSPSVREAGEQDIHLSPSSAQVGWGAACRRSSMTMCFLGRKRMGGLTEPGQGLGKQGRTTRVKLGGGEGEGKRGPVRENSLD